jgi:hypothetical protein
VVWLHLEVVPYKSLLGCPLTGTRDLYKLTVVSEETARMIRLQEANGPHLTAQSERVSWVALTGSERNGGGSAHGILASPGDHGCVPTTKAPDGIGPSLLGVSGALVLPETRGLVSRVDRSLTVIAVVDLVSVAGRSGTSATSSRGAENRLRDSIGRLKLSDPEILNTKSLPLVSL